MESEIEILFFFGGTQADPPITGINQASQHPDLTDVNLEEKRYNDPEGNHVYEHTFSIPLRRTPPGPYFFSFGSGDSGWKYKVGIASMLTVGIAQSRHS